MKEIKEDTNRWRNILCSWIGRINIVKMAILPKAILRKDETGGINLPDFRLYYKTIVIKTIAQRQKSRSMEQNRKPRDKPHTLMDILIFTKELRM